MTTEQHAVETTQLTREKLEGESTSLGEKRKLQSEECMGC